MHDLMGVFGVSGIGFGTTAVIYLVDKNNVRPERADQFSLPITPRHITDHQLLYVFGPVLHVLVLMLHKSVAVRSFSSQLSSSFLCNISEFYIQQLTRM